MGACMPHHRSLLSAHTFSVNGAKPHSALHTSSILERSAKEEPIGCRSSSPALENWYSVGRGGFLKAEG